MKKIILFICIITFTYCKKQAPQGPEGPVGPTGVTWGSGVITGNVGQYNQLYLSYSPPYNTIITQYTTGLNTVSVSIDNSTLTTVTDTAGNYTFSNLPQGVYDISFKKTGAGLSKIQQIICPGTGTLYRNASIYDIPRVTFTGGYISDTAQLNITLKLYYVPMSKPLVLIVVYGKTPNVDIADPDSYQEVLTKPFGQNNTSSITYYLQYPTTFKSQYPSGTKFYARVYPISSLDFGYYDYLKNKGVYTCYGTPLPGTFTLTLP